MKINRVQLPGLGRDVVLLESGVVCLVSQSESESLDEALMCFDSDGDCIWQLDLAGLASYSSIVGSGRVIRNLVMGERET